MAKSVKFENKEGILYITIDRQEALNALNVSVLEELYEVFTMAENNEDVKTVLLTGEGKAFVAGADIQQMYEMSPKEGRDMAKLGHKVMNFIENMEKPVIALINGFALGGGLELALACDFRIASTKAKVGQPEVGLGIIPGFGGTQRLAKLIGKGKAKRLIMTGEIIDGLKALELGIVEEVTEPDTLMEKGVALAETIMKKAPLAVGAAKTAINKSMDVDSKSGSDFEIESFSSVFSTEDKMEGMSAFLEKREAAFKNK